MMVSMLTKDENDSGTFINRTIDINYRMLNNEPK